MVHLTKSININDLVELEAEGVETETGAFVTD